MHIRPSRFLKASMLEKVLDINKKILEELVIVKKICAKLIFGRCVSLDWGDHCKFKAACTLNHKNNMIEIKKKDLKAKFKPFKSKKQ